MRAKGIVGQSISEVSRRSSAKQLGSSTQLPYLSYSHHYASCLLALKHLSFGCLLLHEAVGGEGVPGNRANHRLLSI